MDDVDMMNDVPEEHTLHPFPPPQQLSGEGPDPPTPAMHASDTVMMHACNVLPLVS